MILDQEGRMKLQAVILILLAIVIAVLPQFTDCESQGRHLVLADGREIPMKCHWSAAGELGLGFPLLALGVVLFFSRQAETRRALGILGVVLGLIVILIPTVLIGVCAGLEMFCNSIMKPALILAGSLVMVVGVWVVLSSVRRGESST
jgi:hypothetical protein